MKTNTVGIIEGLDDIAHKFGADVDLTSNLNRELSVYVFKRVPEGMGVIITNAIDDLFAQLGIDTFTIKHWVLGGILRVEWEANERRTIP